MHVKSMGVWIAALIMFGSLCTSVSAQPVPWKLLMQFPGIETDVKVTSAVFLGLDSEKKRYYLVDAAAGNILSFDAAGQFLASFDAAGQLQTPVSMARTRSGKLWIVERAKNQILYVDIQRKVIRDFTLQDQDGHLVVPDRIALDEKDRLYLLDRMSGSVVLVDDDMKISKRYSAPSTSQGFCDFKIKQDSLFALDCLSHKVYDFDLNGNLKESISLNGDLMFPSALEVEGADRIYILDRHKGQINVFDRQGNLKFDFLAKGKQSGQMSYGAYLMLDWDNRLCVVEEGNSRVSVYSRQ